MLKTIARLTTNFAALLTDKATVIDAHSRTEDIRNALLEALSYVDRSEHMGSAKAWADIARASDIQTLWYLRSDVLRVLSDFHGEEIARAKLDAMTEMFRGIIPPSQMPSRRSKER